MMSVKVNGLSDLDKALSELTKATGRNVARRAMLAAGQPIRDAMVQNAPGHIKDAIEIGTKLTPRQAKLSRANKSPIEIYVGVSYRLGMRGRTAHLFEFGTRQRVRKNGGATGRIAARPFVRPAWDQHKGTALEILKDEMWKNVQKATERARRKAERDAAKAAAGA
jgi:HK97 gp10 family phage protein